MRGASRTALVICALLMTGGVRAAWAQPADHSHIEVSGGLRWIGAVRFGAVAANETTFGGGNRPLFNSETTLDASPGGAVLVGVGVTQMLRAEFAFAYNPTGLSTKITADAEGVADQTVTAPVTQLLAEGGIVAQPPRWRKARVSPFLTAGLGYLRQLNDGRTLVETGRSYYVGGGLYYVRASTRPRRVKATGIRADVRALILRDGVAPDSTARVTAAVTAAVFARF